MNEFILFESKSLKSASGSGASWECINLDGSTQNGSEPLGFPILSSAIPIASS